MSNKVVLRHYEKYSVLTINRPEKRNAISSDVIALLDRCLDEIIASPSTRLLIINGSGNQAFCAGGDLNEFHGDMSEEEAYTLLSSMQHVLWKLFTLPIPTIAWMNGSARGGGMEIASACDFRFVRPDSSYGFTQGQLGIATGWGGGTLLYKRIEAQIAFYWLIEAGIKSAEELHSAGFAQEIMEDAEIDVTNILLRPFTQRSNQQLRHWKSQWLRSLNLNELKDQMNEEVRACSKLWVSEEHKVAVKNFFKK
ncbi:enoyl-CoA hydratase/isomerase family protein [Halalkalibacillus halophilus]|uniref:enoyl-CoA hydratase/isomerase family protein n=1 Tax=Halalkalibacillus halophilus TaxID=392827 RepID=UPI001469B664|nr:enoyl-CoA hydratase/isomerase family protein [Halalkalibacillus halophilus]